MARASGTVVERATVWTAQRVPSLVRDPWAAATVVGAVL